MLLDLNIIIILGEEYKSRSFSSLGFLTHPLRPGLYTLEERAPLSIVQGPSSRLASYSLLPCSLREWERDVYLNNSWIFSSCLTDNKLDCHYKENNHWLVCEYGILLFYSVKSFLTYPCARLWLCSALCRWAVNTCAHSFPLISEQYCSQS
jgi:hypothetical protein